MAINIETKKKIFKKFGGAETNTGSSESQIALFTKRIEMLTEHLKTYKNDIQTERALVKIVSKRKKLLEYLKRKNLDSYRKLIKELDLRK